MKKQFLIFGLILFFGGSPVIAHELDGFSETTRARILVPESTQGFSAQGFRLGFQVPNYFLSVNSQNIEGSSVSRDFQTDLRSVSLGYVSIPESGLGFIGGLHLGIDSRFLSQKSFYRLFGGGAYAFNEVLNIKTALNFSNARFADVPYDLSPGLGVQAGFGVQLNQSYGLDFDYVLMNQTARTANNQFVDIQQSGLEIGLNLTF